MTSGIACGSTWELPWGAGAFGGSATPRGVNGFDLWSTNGPDGAVSGHIDDFSMMTHTPVVTPLQVAVSGDTDAANNVVGTGTTLAAGAGTVTVTDTLLKRCTTTTGSARETSRSLTMSRMA